MNRTATDRRRRILESEFGYPFLTIPEATARLQLSPTAIYERPDKYHVTRYEGSAFVPGPLVNHMIAERIAVLEDGVGREPIEIRGVEYEDGIGRTNVTRHLCFPCRLFFRTRAGFESHDCGGATK